MNFFHFESNFKTKIIFSGGGGIVAGGGMRGKGRG